MSLTSRSRDALLRTLTHTRLFRGVDASFLEELRPHARVESVAQGERVWTRGAPAEHFHVVLRGVLELQRSLNGTESSLIALFGPGESPAIPVTLESLPYIADAYAATPVLDILRVRAAPVLAALPKDAALANAMNRALLAHVKLVHAKVDVLSAGTVPRRIAAFYLDLAERFGDEHEDGTTIVPLALTRAQLATYVGARVETVIRTCSAWQRSGLVTRTPEGFSIASLDDLREILGVDRNERSAVSF